MLLGVIEDLIMLWNPGVFAVHFKQLNLMKSNPSKTNHIFSFFLDWPEDTDSLFHILTTIKYMKHTYRHKYSVCQNYNSVNVFFY